MKKFFFLGAVLASAISLHAEPTDPPITPPGDNNGPIATYYGTEASTNPNNPCKGATTRVCAKIPVITSVGDIDETKTSNDVPNTNSDKPNTTVNTVPQASK